MNYNEKCYKNSNNNNDDDDIGIGGWQYERDKRQNSNHKLGGGIPNEMGCIKEWEKHND